MPQIPFLMPLSRLLPWQKLSKIACKTTLVVSDGARFRLPLSVGKASRSMTLGKTQGSKQRYFFSATENRHIRSLASGTEQSQLLEALVVDKSHLEYPLIANGNVQHDTVQAVFQGLLYLHEAAREVAAEVGRDEKFLEHFEARCELELPRWQQFEEIARDPKGRSLPPVPRLMLDMVWDEYTRTTKQIALSAVWGPDPKSMAKWFVGEMRRRASHGGVAADQMAKDEANSMAAFERLWSARVPDDLLKPIAVNSRSRLNRTGWTRSLRC